jgi:hypothetical protein
MVPFRFVEFYDVPRCIVLRYRGRLYLLQSAFDECVDDYPSEYSVYALPESVEDLLEQSSWEFLKRVTTEAVGRIRVDSVEFDRSKRTALNPSCLDELLAAVD